ncbi:phosphoribosylanthranilate isomerase [Andreprevotia lacus DSM 23236]|jgi:phosphoribosylanthranilate isomerase|uniref:N-(5'-phosphoribosyl)anthranilate isomerase n=1 Tax=Andreprevotia lacus DSM 23236 TaxID=1121001 RepID=A0A1W1XIJ1_9NEIS|nr:phosphoribosylanthranilate isomerase [Andreprevotia lacus]SMC23647.1 phosphoribosylanthranilate isomerase [Andreprevotia lacus DSM 23236]
MNPRIKICGLRDAQTARFTAEAGADAIGLVFYPPSPRHVETAVAAQIVAALPAFVSSVGLFVDADAAFVREVIAQTGIDLLQFHGDESPDYCRQFGRPYIKAVRVKPDTNLVEYCTRYADARGVLVDAFVDGTPGGTGEAFDWSLLPRDLPLPLILSGGLHPENVTDAVRQLRPWAVDVSSGVEASRGVKDRVRIQSFIQAVAAANT